MQWPGASHLPGGAGSEMHAPRADSGDVRPWGCPSTARAVLRIRAQSQGSVWDTQGVTPRILFCVAAETNHHRFDGYNNTYDLTSSVG